MKNFLLSIFAVMLAVFSVQAEEVTLNASDVVGKGKSGGGGGFEYTVSPISFNFSSAYGNSSTELRFYKSSTLEISGATITKVQFTAASSKYGGTVTANSGSITVNGLTQTWEGSTTSLIITATGSQIRTASIVVTYTTSGEGGGDTPEPVDVAEPTFTPADGETFEENLDVTIAAEEGLAVYYSTDNKVSYTKGNSLNITETTTVYAYAKNTDGDVSDIVSATYTKVVPVSIAQAKEAYDNAGGATNVAIDLTDAVVTVNSGKYMFIQDSESGINVYNSGETYPVGTKFTSGLLVGSSEAYNGMHQIAAGAKFEGVETTTADITPIVVTVALLNEEYAAYEGRYVKLEGVALSGTTITQGDNTYTLFNRFNITLEDAVLCDIEGVPACFGTTLQIFPTAIIPAAAVALPEVSVASGTTIEQGAEITITPAVDNVVTYSVNGAAAVEIDGETTIVANEIGEMTLVVTSTYGGETLTETYTYTVVAPIEKVTAILTSEDIMAIGTSSSRYEDIEVASACGVWTGLSYINKAGYLQLRSTEGEYIQSPIFPGRILSVTLTINNTNKRTFTVSDIDGNKLAENKNEGIAGEELLFNITSDVTAFKVESNGTTQISNIYVVYEKPADFQLSVSEAAWATLYLGLDASIPAGVKCYTIAEDAVNAEYVTLSQFEGNVLPAHTAVIVEANEGVYTFEYADNYSGLLSGNLLKGSVADEYVAGDAYVLGNVNGIGLYKAVLNKNEAGEAGTTHFKNNANKAYLVVPGASEVASYSFRFGEGTTGVEKVEIRNLRPHRPSC